LGLAFLLVVVARWCGGPPLRRRRGPPYRDETACLLTDEHGITGAQAVPIWAGLQEGSLASLVKVHTGDHRQADRRQCRAVRGDLAQGGCDMVFAAGDVALAALDRSASTFPRCASTRWIGI